MLRFGRPSSSRVENYRRWRLCTAMIVALVSGSVIGPRAMPLAPAMAADVASIGSITEFSIPTSHSDPYGITSGPDGNLWFTESDDDLLMGANKIGRMAPTGAVTEFRPPTSVSRPRGITTGRDGNIWFTEAEGDRIGRITPRGVITEFLLPSTGSYPEGIAAGPDGNIWFTENGSGRIGRITPRGVITEFSLPSGRCAFCYGPYGITAGPDGNIWFTESDGYRIGRITPKGAITEFSLRTGGGHPQGITAGPDGNLWFAEPNGIVARITPKGAITGFHVNGDPQDITSGPDGNLWFIEVGGGKIGRITPKGIITEFALSGHSGYGGYGITSGPDGNIWFTRWGANEIGRVATGSPPKTTACPLWGLNWYARCYVSNMEGLVLQDVRIGSRYMVQKISVGYVNVEYRLPGMQWRRVHLLLSPDVTKRGGDGSFLWQSRLLSPPSVKKVPGRCGFNLCRPDQCPQLCNPPAYLLRAQYRVDLNQQHTVWLDIEQRYEFYATIDEEKDFDVAHNTGYVPCEPGEVLPGWVRFVSGRHLLTCARLKPIVEYWFHAPAHTGVAVTVAQRLHFRPDDQTVQAASLFYDCNWWVNNDELSGANEQCNRPPLFPAGVGPGIAFYRNERAIGHEVLQTVIAPRGANNQGNYIGAYDNIHLTEKSEIQLPLPPPGCEECVHIHWFWGKDTTKGVPTAKQQPGCLGLASPIVGCWAPAPGPDLSRDFGNAQPLLGDGKAWPTANPKVNEWVRIALVSNHPNENTPSDIGALVGLHHDASGFYDVEGEGNEPLVDPVLWVASTAYWQWHGTFFPFGMFFSPDGAP